MAWPTLDERQNPGRFFASQLSNGCHAHFLYQKEAPGLELLFGSKRGESVAALHPREAMDDPPVGAGETQGDRFGENKCL